MTSHNIRLKCAIVYRGKHICKVLKTSNNATNGILDLVKVKCLKVVLFWMRTLRLFRKLKVVYNFAISKVWTRYDNDITAFYHSRRSVRSVRRVHERKRFFVSPYSLYLSINGMICWESICARVG